MTRHFPLLAASAMPLAICGSPRANADVAKVLAELNGAFVAFKDRNESRLNGLESALDNALLQASAGRLSLGDQTPVDPEYSKLFAAWMRDGNGTGAAELKRLNNEGYRAQVQATMSGTSGSAGGYLAPTEWDRQLHRAQKILSPMRRLAQVISTGVGAFSTVWSDGAWGSGWVGETAARGETATPVLSSIEFAHGEIYANAPITQRLLDDAGIDLESWLAAEFAEEFAVQEGVAFVNGNGTNKPFGFLQYVTGGAADGRHPGGNLTVKNGGHASTVVADGLSDFVYSHPAPYRTNATWLMNSATAGTIAKLKAAGSGDYIWRESLAAGQPATLLGYPVEIDEQMPDIAANALPIAFGDFARGYLINDRIGTSILRDPYTNKPYVNFYGTKRVGGGVIDPKAIRLLKIAA